MGLKKTVLTTLPITLLSNFTQVAMLKTGPKLDDERVNVQNVYQYVDPKSGSYGNYIHIELPADIKHKDAIAVVTRGFVTFPGHKSFGCSVSCK